MSDTNSKTEHAAVIIFGASGDLTRRKLVPALHTLACEVLLPKTFHALGVARTELTEDEFRKQLYEGVVEYSRLNPGVCEKWPQFANQVAYLAGSYEDDETYMGAYDRIRELDPEFATNGNLVFYLATPPSLYPTIIDHLGQTGLSRSDGGFRRIIIEKPFGRDLNSAQSLNRQIHAAFDESQVYRIDHYLGKETVQNIITFRFGNEIFEPLWNRNHVDNVQITVAEDIGVGHRAGYYDTAGVIRDMVQNHMLQLLAITAMEPPAAFDEKPVRDEKVKVLKAIRTISPRDIVLGQYQGYRKEPGVSKDSKTPTYIAMKLYLDNWRWQGVPFYLRTGKSLAVKSTGIVLQFKRVPLMMFQDEEPSPNRITICIQPDEGHHLRFETKVPGAGMKTTAVDMAFHYSDLQKQALPEAYERLLLDSIQGDPSLFARSDEIELAWSIVDPILDGKGQPNPQLFFYEAGGWGPIEAEKLIAQDGRTWHVGCAGH